MNDAGIMKRIDSIDEDVFESMHGRCDYEHGDEICIASATRMFVVTSRTVRIAGKAVKVELLACDDHADEMRQDLQEPSAVLTFDSEHAYEHQCAPVYATDRGEYVRYTCDCGHVVGVE